MKKYLIYILIFGGIVFTSCKDDLLDKGPLDTYSETAVWSDANLAQAFIYNTYATCVGQWVETYSPWSDDWTDNIICNSDNSARNVQAGAFTNTSDFGWNRFSYIRRCNLAIEKLANNDNIPESTCKLLSAEARMMRAMIYFWQARRFGGLMLVDKVLTQDDDLKLSRSSEEETYNFIISDIETAIPDLPLTTDAGRLTKGAGYAFLTRVALQAGKYDKVISAADSVEALGLYTLDTYSNMFNNFDNTVASPEIILLYYRDEDHTTFYNTRMFGCVPNVANGAKLNADAIPQLNDEFPGWPQRWPSQELVDDYLFKDGSTAVQKKGSEFVGQLPYLMWQNRDDRFEVSIVRDSSKFNNSIVTLRRGGNMHWTSNPLSTWGMPKSGYIVRKWMYEPNYMFYNYPIDWAAPLLRLGEVYLNKAEAYYRLGSLAEAIEYTNKTRTIHGGLPEIPASTSAADFYNLYKIERRVELFAEDDRYWSLIRWARADDASSIPELDGYKLHALDITDGKVQIEESEFTVTMSFEYPKRLFFPVPYSEVTANPNLTQNPGWE